MLGKTKEFGDDFNLDRAARHRSAGLGKRVSGRLQKTTGSPALLPFVPESENDTVEEEEKNVPHSRVHGFTDALSQIRAWVHEEKLRRHSRRAERRSHRTLRRKGERSRAGVLSPNGDESPSSSRRGSDASAGSTALEKLEAILEQTKLHAETEKIVRRKSINQPRRPSSYRKLRTQSTVTAVSSEVDLGDLDRLVPSCDAVLDNTKTLSYMSGSASQLNLLEHVSTGSKEREAWAMFKFEIVRLAHTLKIRGWRQVSMENSSHIDVERLSGALTNAVYVVSPPHDLPPVRDETTSEIVFKKPPA